MTRRERIEARIERRRAWVESRDRKAAAGFATAKRIADGIPFGQPILVGHHSERHARRDQERIHNGMARGVENAKMADEHESKAANLEHSLRRAIFRDDDDAIERLTAKIAKLEASRAVMVAANKIVRSKKLDDAQKVAELVKLAPVFTEAKAAELLKPDFCGRIGFPAYTLQNLGGNITRERKRLAELTAEKTSTGPAIVQQTGATATERAGLTITATMTTPAKAWKKPRPVWNVSGNLAFWRPLLVDNLGGSWYRGVVSFWEDPADDIERECLQAEADEQAKTAAPDHDSEADNAEQDANDATRASADPVETWTGASGMKHTRPAQPCHTFRPLINGGSYRSKGCAFCNFEEHEHRAPEPMPANPTPSRETDDDFFKRQADKLTEGRTIWNSDGTEGPCLICPPPSDRLF